MRFVGAPIKRLEDPRLLAGGGRYVDDLARPGAAHAVVVRSPHAHAHVRRVDPRRALAAPGVLACLTPADLAGVPAIPLRQPGKPAHAAYLQPPLAGDRVRYVGEPVAVVVATDRAAAAARELVEVAYDSLPARVDPGDGGPLLFAQGDVAIVHAKTGSSWNRVGEIRGVTLRKAALDAEETPLGGSRKTSIIHGCQPSTECAGCGMHIGSQDFARARRWSGSSAIRRPGLLR